MLDMHTQKTRTSHVMALYPDGWELFDLPAGETLIDLARRLDTLADMHHAVAVEIKIHFDPSPRHSITAIPLPLSTAN